MFTRPIAIASMILLSGCADIVKSGEEDKPLLPTSAQLKTVDLACISNTEEPAGPYTAANRISFDFVNNRIDMFSRDQVWQFHSVNGISTRDEFNDITIMRLKNGSIVAWGMRRQMPFNFYVDNVRRTVSFSYQLDGTPSAVMYQCT